MDGYFFTFNKLNYLQDRKSKSGCILCKIEKGDQDVPDMTVYRTELFNVSVNLYPYNPGHLMIFPKRHIEDIRLMTEEENLSLCLLQKQFLDILDKVQSPEGYNIGYNMGHIAGASICHIHLHIIPRYPNEIGIGELLGGKKVMVEDPRVTRERLIKAAEEYFCKQ